MRECPINDGWLAHKSSKRFFAPRRPKITAPAASANKTGCASRFFIYSDHSSMGARSVIARLCQNESVNFVFSNRIPRRLATRVAGWFSTIEQPVVRDISMAVWRFFSDVDLSEAKKTRFASLRDCFVRELKDGARPINQNPKILISPCDGIVGG